jgi:hypothetical protein
MSVNIPDRDVSAEQSADDIEKEVFDGPALTINELCDDPLVRLRVGRILALAADPAGVSKTRFGRRH